MSNDHNRYPKDGIHAELRQKTLERTKPAQEKADSFILELEKKLKERARNTTNSEEGRLVYLEPLSAEEKAEVIDHLEKYLTVSPEQRELVRARLKLSEMFTEDQLKELLKSK